MSELPVGTVTFLFTDIEGSTRHWEEQSEAMRSALAQHDALLRSAIEAHGGHVFKTVGDAFCSAFPTAPDALAAAVAAQRVLLHEDWPTAEPLRVRMALHSGAAELRDGDYFGQPLNRVARLLSSGHGGQILLSLPTTELARDALPDGVRLDDLGEHRLKDLIRPERVFQAVGADLPSGFPPLRTLASHPNNLPLLLTSFVGRERELAEVRALLGTTRLLTLAGPGGVGKTRLSLQVAADVVESFADGAWLVELAPLTDPTLVAQEAATALGLREVAGQPPLETLISYLQSRRLLLLLDNCEHLIDASAALAETLLRRCPELQVLTTSREPLGIAGETVWRVPSLALPDAGEVRGAPTAASLTQYEAVRLFVERALAALPSFAVTNANAPAVAQICQRLDGIPLAIELAAARVRLLSPEQILARLNDRFRLLTGGSRTALPRQQTLRAAIDWSYDLLSEDERGLLLRLSVFSGGCSLEAVEAVCDAAPALAVDVLDGVALLVDKSLLRQEEAATGEPRFLMLETIRDYAAEKLRESGDEPAVRRAHLHYFRLLAEHAEGQLKGAAQLAWVQRLEAEHDNIRAALAWADAQKREPEEALRLATALIGFWWHSHAHEGIRLLTRAFEAAHDAPAPLRARSLFVLGYMTQHAVGQAEGRPLLEEAAALCRQVRDDGTLAMTLSCLGMEALTRGDAAAVSLAAESVALGRRASGPWDLAFILMSHGYVAYVQGDDVTARRSLEEIINLCRSIGDTWLLAASLGLLGEVAYRLGDHAGARARCEESVDLLHQLGDKTTQGVFVVLLGRVALGQGDHGRARAAFAEGLAINLELNNIERLVVCLTGFASLAWREGDAIRAARLFGAVEAIRERLGIAYPDPSYRGEYQAELSAVRAGLSEPASAKAWNEGEAMSPEQAAAYAQERAEG